MRFDRADDRRAMRRRIMRFDRAVNSNNKKIKQMFAFFSVLFYNENG